MSQQDLLTQLETELRSLLHDVRTQFIPLDPDQLTYRSAPETWNVLECVAHLNQYFEDYLPRIELAIHKAKARRWLSSADPVAYTSRGQRAIRRADPQNGKTYKSAKHYNFSQVTLGKETLKSFIINCERLLRILQVAREIDINRATVKKARSGLGKYSVANLLEFLVTHTQRHVQQAKRYLP